MRALLSFAAPSLFLGVLFAGTASATITYDQNVTPAVIFGSGNANGGFTVDQENHVEVGLEAHIRFPFTTPTTTLSQGNGNYGPFNSGSGGGGGTNSTWNFDWSINTNYDGLGSFMLNSLTYQLRLDIDPGAGTNFVTLDPNVFAFGNAIGNNSTASGGGTVAPDAATYSTLIANNNVLQNSGRFNFYLTPAQFDANQAGQYTIQLAAFNGTNLLAETSIDVFVQTPEPTSVASMSFGLLACGGLLAWRRRSANA